MSYTIAQINQALTIVRRAEEDIRSATGMEVGLQIIALSQRNQLTPELITRLVAEEAGITYESIIGRDRRVRYLFPRFAAISLIRALFPSLSLNQIGVLFVRDHTTVINALRSGRALLETSDRFRSFYQMLTERIKAAHDLPDNDNQLPQLIHHAAPQSN